MSETIARIRAVRAGNRGVLTKLSKEAEAYLNDSTTLNKDVKGRLQTIMILMNEKITIIKGLDGKVLDLCEVEDIAKEIEEADEIISRTLDIQRVISEVLSTKSDKVSKLQEPTKNVETNEQLMQVNEGELQVLDGVQNQTTTPGIESPIQSPGVEPAIQTTTPNSNLGTQVETPAHGIIRPKLPKLILNKFKGNVTQWGSFWDSYKTAVHENIALSSIDKFNYLNSLLEGAAARSIQGLSLTADNYNSAVEILHKRFGKKQQIITSHMDELLKLPPCTTDRTASLRYIYDKISVHVRGLESLGVSADQYGSLLIPIVMDKLPSDIRLQVARKATSDVWEINELLNVIESEIEAREASELKSQLSNKPSNEKNRQFEKSTASSLFTSDFKPRCVYCNGEHYSASCTDISGAKERKEILRKTGRCYVCLKTNHQSKDCNSQKRCRHCNNKHHQSICDQVHNARPPPQDPPKFTTKETKGQTEKVTTTSATTGIVNKNTRTVLLQTARAIAFNESNNRSTPIRVLFDNGSQRSYITDNLRSRLGLSSVKQEKLKLNTFGESRYKTQNCEVVKLQLKKPGSDQSVSINALSFPVLCSPLPSRISMNCLHLEGLELADNWNESDGSIDLLIGSDHYWDIVTGETRSGETGPTAVNSSLGWLLSGPVNGTMNGMGTHSNLIISRPAEAYRIATDETHLVKTIEKFWETESIGIKEPSCQDVDDLFNPNVSYSDKRYEVTLPWKEERPSDHYNLSYNRLKSLQRRLIQEPELLQEYDQIIKDQLEAGIIEKVPQQEIDQSQDVHYMPHHGVVRSDKQTTKLRVVYDGSATPGGGELSINDCLHPGPNLIPKLVDVLVKFRCHPVAISADIEKAFLMIGVSKVDRDMLRFLWFEDPPNTNSEIIHLRFTRLVFGLRPSPAILSSTIRQHLEKYRDIYPNIVQLIEDSLYVDDLVSGADDDLKAFEVYQTSKKVMAAGSFNLRKWQSNSETLMKQIDESETGVKAENEHVLISGAIKEEDETYTKSTIGSSSVASDGKVVKLLGVSWNCESDELFFNLADLIDFVETLPVTKRSLLRLTAKIFDPLGMLSPFVVKLKHLFQVICQEKKDWDEPLEGEMLQEWNTIVNELASLNSIRMPRCYFILHLRPVKMELHAFSDASNKAYAAVVYMRSIYDDGHVQVRFIASKTRVAPLRKQTIPRLELLGAVILARLVSTLIKCLPYDLTVTYWVDATTVLYWIKNERLWKQYVNHRVNEIRQLTNKDDWRFCPGTENPADLATRGLSGEDLLNNRLWWNGPSFLENPEENWPACPASSTIDESVSLELVKNPPQLSHSLVITEEKIASQVNISKVIDCQTFNDFTRLLRVTAYVLRFIRNLKRKANGSQIQSEALPKELSASELDESEAVWLRTVQSLAFENEIQYLNGHQRSSPPVLVSQFGLSFDKRGIIRCKGRINETSLPQSTKNPILLPSKHHLSTLIIRETHERTKHSGLRDTLATIRERFWILKGREAVKKNIRHCVVCRKVEGKPYRPACVPDLPSYRVSEDPPFSHTGLDFAGPLYIKQTGNKFNQ